jgi:hypothetical protein
VSVEFWIYHDQCPRRPAMLGFITQRYYPSLPIYPEFVLRGRYPSSVSWYVHESVIVETDLLPGAANICTEECSGRGMRLERHKADI